MSKIDESNSMFAHSTVYPFNRHPATTTTISGSVSSMLHDNEDIDGGSMSHQTSIDGSADGQCMVCGDRSAGKHYGVMACYGCKGFFRRTIRSAQTYSCRFDRKCAIDKDQRNACRYCRFQRCLNVGMEPEAIRPDRDIIGKQKNPRKKKIAAATSSSSSTSLPRCDESSSLPSPGCDSPVSNNEDVILSFLVDVEEQASGGSGSSDGNPIGISLIKSDPDFDASTLFHSQYIRKQESFKINYSMGRCASVEKLIAALRRYALSAVHWIDALFDLAQCSNVDEKVALLKAVIAPFTVFSMAARSAQILSDGEQIICLCNQSTISRHPARHLLDTNLVSNNFVGRVIDDLLAPTKKLQLSNNEIIILSAMIILDADARGLSSETSQALASIRDRVQNALFNMIRDLSSNMGNVTSRFGNLLLLFPPLAKLSSIICENVQLAKMFGISTDPLLFELYADVDSPEVISTSSSTRERADVSTQTQSDPNLYVKAEDDEVSSESVANIAADLIGLFPTFDASNTIAPPTTTSAVQSYTHFYNMQQSENFVPHTAPPMLSSTYTNAFFENATSQQAPQPQNHPMPDPFRFG